MPFQFIEAEPRRNRSTPMTVTLSVAKTGARSGRLSSTALDAVKRLSNGNAPRLRVGLDGKRVALVPDPNGRELSTSGSFTGYELSKALGNPSGSVKHSVTIEDGVVWVGARVALKGEASK